MTETEEKTDYKKVAYNLSILREAINAIERREEEKFFKEVAKKTVGKRGDRYNDTRSIVMNIHFNLEQIMNNIIAFSCVLGIAKLGQRRFRNLGEAFAGGGTIELLGQKGRFRELADAFSGVDYFKKLSITEALSVFSQESITILKRVNCVRRAFAHNYKEGHSDYKYKGKLIFNKETIKKMLEDQRKILREGSDLIMSYAKKKETRGRA